MRQQDRIAKTYRGLTTDQLAVLAFHYLTDANELEFERVVSAVPRKDYRCPDLDYQARLDSFRWFAACWAIEHWRLRCRRAEKLGGFLASLRRGNEEKADDFLEERDQAERELLALDAALLAICVEQGIDPADVRRIAGTEPFKAKRAGTVTDAEIQAVMQAGFSQLVSV